MPHPTSLDEIIGIESIKLGFFKEVQQTISELRASNIELEQKRQDIQAILNGIPDVMAVLTLDYEILSVNNAFHERYPGVKPCGKTCHQIFKGQGTPCPHCSLTQAMEGAGRVCRHLELMVFHGEKRQIECTASLMRDAHGNPNRVILLQRDVTLEKQYQAQYLQAERMATIGVLAEGVAHEINNPLTSISGFAEAMAHRMEKLAMCPDQDSIAPEFMELFGEYLEIILKECNRCSEIVRNLLTFGHRDVRAYSIVDLNDVVHNCLQLLHPRLSRLPRGVIKLHLSEKQPYVLGHPGELMQVILNLVLNALYAVMESGEIAIHTAVEGRLVLLRVIDTGHGIPKEILDKLFDPFFTTKPAGQGIGIGLSTCYNIIKNHGGEISVDSTYTEGACFETVLPYCVE
ncbi:PAS domain-containing protein [Desulfovibrio sulfodismutans]|uniref:histidine kinase n=1 Tax=Desulfolutivibrio sulfodismutans TaxID=63561 RepID=A0A7K3NHZ7_9BACT|nr:ATP-binding protein [Desulfolutivibrio sulfodismutans]NDY55433.1 PAS domain-containing protein [Desulfolutivibrio sulfodismutans]QLA12195.1 PAS domain-containing protein [Desulfolutivibrio sulfodismutans DSM 3696]